MEKLDMILNTCLNDAMCKVGRIKQPNSNKIAEFVTNELVSKRHRMAITVVNDVDGMTLMAKFVHQRAEKPRPGTYVQNLVAIP